MEPEFQRPFPALTPAQRYHFDAFGYVVVPGVLSPEECTAIQTAMRRVRDKIRARPAGYQTRPGEPRFISDQPHHVFIGDMMECDPLFAAYATHPRLVGMAEEVIGGEARIVELNAHLNTRSPQYVAGELPRFDFHNGTDVPFSSHTKHGLYHCSFVKTLTNLTELGPDDGGTVVIAGSHKIDLPVEEQIALAYEDRSLIHQVVAPAGSTLLFAETLIHATGQLRSERERAIIITGYGSSLFPYWGGAELTPGFVAKIPARLHTLYFGKAHWTRGPRYRRLTDPVDECPFTLADGWHPA
ncbi:MAG: phytanoyl-CoA dioxygenase family protein [Opitutaceae bacterium]|nr:phytanoyl-CoA dioxygenase family protein [Opitutaceae bacterium]